MNVMNYTGTMVTRCRLTGHTDAFSFSGYTSWGQLLDAVAQRARHQNVIQLIGVGVESARHVESFNYNENEVRELISK